MDRELTVACALVLISEKARFCADRCDQPNIQQSLVEIVQHAKEAISVFRNTEKASWSKCLKCSSRKAEETPLPSCSRFTCLDCGTKWTDHYGGER